MHFHKNLGCVNVVLQDRRRGRSTFLSRWRLSTCAEKIRSRDEKVIAAAWRNIHSGGDLARRGL